MRGKHAPGTAALQDVENAIQYCSPAALTWTTNLCFGWQVWSNFKPLGIIEVGRVGLLRCGHPVSLPDLPTIASLSDPLSGVSHAFGVGGREGTGERQQIFSIFKLVYIRCTSGSPRFLPLPFLNL